MKRPLLFLAAAVVPLAACNMVAEARDAGPAAERVEAIGDFDRLSVSGPYDVVVNTGSAATLSLSGPENVLEDTEIGVEDGRLKIEMKDGRRWDWGRQKGVDVSITVPMLRAAGIAGSGQIAIDRVETDAFKGSVAGSGDLKIAELTTGGVEFSIAGSGDIQARGKAESGKYAISGSGSIDSPDLETVDLKVSIAGSGDVRGKATGQATVSTAGSGDVELTGGAKCNTKSAGSGRVVCS